MLEVPRWACLEAVDSWVRQPSAATAAINDQRSDRDLKTREASIMTTWSDPPAPEVYYRERLTASPTSLVVAALICLAVTLGPAHLYSVWIRGHDPAWFRMFVVGATWGVVTAAIIGVWNHLTVITINSQAIVCPAQIVHLNTIISWHQLSGRDLRRCRMRLASDQGGPHPIGIGIWALRGGRNKAFCPPWMPTGFLIERSGEPILVGTRHPEEFLAALRAALGPGMAHDIESGKAARERLIPPEIKEAARRVVDDLMPRHSSNGQFHGHHRKQHEQPPR